MRLLVDEQVPDSVAAYLSGRQHEVWLVRERLSPGTPDPMLVAVADQHRAIVVTIDRDFHQLITRQPANNHNRHRWAGRISFKKCGYAWALRCIEQALPLIEAEHARPQTQTDTRLTVEIGTEAIHAIR